MKKIICLLAATYFAAVSVPAMARQGAAPQRGGAAEQMFGKVDANGDGVITRKEFEDYNNKRFDRLDANHDGKITPQEVQAALERARQRYHEQMRNEFNRRFDAADANHDGALSKDEAKNMPGIARHFDELDTNHDGRITREEISAFMNKARSGQLGNTSGGGQSK
jgi:Ca2+-binding EF-hand superfamily protein